MNTLQFIDRVRRRLDNPFPQSPTTRNILDRGMSFYRSSTMLANNTANSWVVDEFELVTVENIRRYQVDMYAPEFSKALLVASVPDAVNRPELPLEFTQLEQMPQDWPYLDKSATAFDFWQGVVAQNARLIAFFRKMIPGTGMENWVEIRPAPEAGERYRVLYQVGDWQSFITRTDLEEFVFPFPEFDFYFVALVASSLLPEAKWHKDDEKNIARRNQIAPSIAGEVTFHKPVFDAFISSLSHSDIVYAESFGDQYEPFSM